ncbi:hypothetical protein [Nocardia puris]|uniref:Type VII secretion system (Wss) protein ESAT-6 n=1 Tax=Nocardia puris TaxID=208602 RepID=A0A366DBI7_9NOCA|nr:hypothetical protein [Nocardia puris]RBO87376.1 hypothetical protein DFR74_11182 [Nocardia puris]
MTDYPELAESKLAELREKFSDAVDEVKKTPDIINDTVDDLKIVAWPIYLKVTGVRDDIQAKLKELFAELEKANEGMFAPWLFVDYAARWQALGAEVGVVNRRVGRRELSMDGRWDGSAAKAFNATKLSQQAAMTGITDMCNTIHDQLIIVAQEGRTLYYNIINNLATIVANVATFSAETSVTAGAAAIWTVNNLNSAVVTAVELVVQAMADFVETQTKVWQASNTLTNLIKSPAGLEIDSNGNHTWPATVTDQFDNKSDDWKLDGED